MRNGEDNAEVDYERVCGLGRGSTAGANEGELSAPRTRQGGISLIVIRKVDFGE